MTLRRTVLGSCALLILLALAASPLVAAEAPAEATAPQETAIDASVAPGACPAPELDAVGNADGPEPVQLACSCRDQCVVDSDCAFYSQFVCGGEPASCVMANSCCRECVCLASS